VADAVGDHRVQQGDAAGDVVREVAARVDHRLSRLDEAAVVDHGFEGVGGHQPRQRVLAAGVRHDELGVGVHGLTVAAYQAIEDGDGVTALKELIDGDATDVTGAADDQGSHLTLPQSTGW